MPENKHLRFFLWVGYLLVGYFFITKVLPVAWTLLLPFVAAFVVAAISHPLMLFLRGRWKFPKWLATTVSLLLILIILSTVVSVAVTRLVQELSQLLAHLPQLIQSLTWKFEALSAKWMLFHDGLSPEQSIYLNDLIARGISAATAIVEPLAKSGVNGVSNVARGLPNLFIFTVTFVLASIFITGDYARVKHNLLAQLPGPMQQKAHTVKRLSTVAVGKYLKGMGVLLLITFTELLIGFLIIRVPYAFVLALLIALVDIFPVFGTGTILIPWALIVLITGNYRLAIALGILYGVVTVVRQFLEPKVMSSSMGTYPLITLISMYLGLKLFGVVGMILGPITMLILLYLQSEGVIQFWKGSDSLPHHDPKYPR